MTIKLTPPQEALLRALAQGRTRGATPTYKPRELLLSYGLVRVAPSLTGDAYGLELTREGWAWLGASKRGGPHA